MYFSIFGWTPSGLASMSHILALGSMVMRRSRTSLSRKGTLASRPFAMVALLALRTSHWCSLVVFLTLSLWNSLASGASWKYRYPPRASSAPSPLRTILTPRALIFLASRNMGTAALTWCQDSRWYTTLGTASIASSGVKWNSWCSVPRKSATFLAFWRSGAPSMPMLKVWSFSDQSSEFLAWSLCFAAIAVTREESRPPERRTP
mmetsp:Transcript_4894/g.14666  ORF Transcript_4894/g.14666 Transcript_4894/m.14666 type:complete len:205 (+) Transcript_4894:679-1293(+)